MFCVPKRVGVRPMSWSMGINPIVLGVLRYYFLHNGNDRIKETPIGSSVFLV